MIKKSSVLKILQMLKVLRKVNEVCTCVPVWGTWAWTWTWTETCPSSCVFATQDHMVLLTNEMFSQNTILNIVKTRFKRFNIFLCKFIFQSIQTGFMLRKILRILFNIATLGPILEFSLAENLPNLSLQDRSKEWHCNQPSPTPTTTTTTIF